MAHITADRVRDTSTTTSTGSLTVSGTAPTGYRTFSAVSSTSDTFYYALQHQSADEWEVGLGTYSGTNTIARTTILASSNAGSVVNLSAGTKDVFITFPAALFDGAKLKVANGGTGLATLTANNVLLGNGTSALQTVAPGSSGNVLTSDGTTWTSAASSVQQSGSDKTTSYTLQTSDVGKYIGVGSGGSITIPDATFATGDVVSVFNNTTGSITITCSITTAYIAGTDSDKATMTLATRGVATILFISSTVCVVIGNVS